MSQFHFQCVSFSLISVCLTLPHIHEGSHSLTLNTLTLAVSSPPSPKDFPACTSATNTGFHGFHAYLQQIQFTHRISCVSVTNTIHSQDFMDEIVLLRFSSTSLVSCSFASNTISCQGFIDKRFSAPNRALLPSSSSAAALLRDLVSSFAIGIEQGSLDVQT